MSSLINISQPSLNEILVSSPYIQALGRISRVGDLQKTFTSPTNALVGDIFFKFYTCDDSSGSKVYSTLDVSSALSDSTIVNQFLTMLFSNYYVDSNLVTDIGGSFPDLRERFLDQTPTTSLSTTLAMPSSSANFLEFVDMGMNSYIGANYINGDSTDQVTALWGNRVGQVHITDQDPLQVGEKIYDNTDEGCWRFSNYNTNGIIVYTNCASSAWEFFGMNTWTQTFCVWPILAEVLNASYATIFTNLDTAFLRNGLGFFDRFTRQDSFFGWAGNYLQSIFNDWGIPLISPTWCSSIIGNAGILTRYANSPTTNFGSLTDPAKLFRSIGPLATNNVSTLVEKNARFLLPLLWANECLFGTESISSSAVLNFQNSYTALGYATGAEYIASTIASVGEGYNSQLYKYITSEKIYPFFNPRNTKSYIQDGVSWYGNLNKQPNLGDCFCDHQNGEPKIYTRAIDDFYGSSPGSFGEALKNRYLVEMPLVIQEMATKDVDDLEAWVYTP